MYNIHAVIIGHIYTGSAYMYWTVRHPVKWTLVFHLHLQIEKIVLLISCTYV